MSRALNLDLLETEVLASCALQNAAISQIETLVSGGTRVVFQNGDHAALMACLHKAKIIKGPVTRSPSRLAHG